MTDTDIELARLRRIVAKVRVVYDALRAREEPRADANVVRDACRIIADAIEDALTDVGNEAAAGPEEGAQ